VPVGLLEPSSAGTISELWFDSGFLPQMNLCGPHAYFASALLARAGIPQANAPVVCTVDPIRVVTNSTLWFGSDVTEPSAISLPRSGGNSGQSLGRGLPYMGLGAAQLVCPDPLIGSRLAG
jgi:hypothetical protein